MKIKEMNAEQLKDLIAQNQEIRNEYCYFPELYTDWWVDSIEKLMDVELLLEEHGDDEVDLK